jgi:predicted phosphoribosyltransferase
VPIDCIRVRELDSLDRTVAAARLRHPDTHGLLRDGPPGRELIAAAMAQEADLVVLGTHGRRGLPRWLLGSVAQDVVRRSPVPVMTVHGFWFEDRAHAGRDLAKALAPIRASAPTVLAIGRGAILVAAEVAHALGVRFDALFTRELQRGGFAIGAVCEDGTLEIDKETKQSSTHAELGQLVAPALSAVKEDALRFRGPRWIVDLAETVVLVSDELMDPWRAWAAARCVRKLGAKRVIVATPIGDDASIGALAPDVDEVIAVRSLRLRADPAACYHHFRAARDNELKLLLRDAATSAA